MMTSMVVMNNAQKSKESDAKQESGTEPPTFDREGALKRMK